VVPVTISGTHYVMPKKRFSIKAGLVTIVFNKPIEPSEFGSREELTEKVRAAINAALPAEYQT
jgi:1-acyl-sn-glycerol-3-phosphate acyltransferase